MFDGFDGEYSFFISHTFHRYANAVESSCLLHNPCRDGVINGTAETSKRANRPKDVRVDVKLYFTQGARAAYVVPQGSKASATGTVHGYLYYVLMFIATTNSVHDAVRVVLAVAPSFSNTISPVMLQGSLFYIVYWRSYFVVRMCKR